MKEEIKYRVKSIIEVLVFLIVMTAFWFGPRENIAADMSRSINDHYMNKRITVDTNKELTFDNKTNFTITNKMDVEQNYEIVIISDYKKMRKNNCTAIENNYLKYKLNDFEEKNLSVEGVIYTGILQPNEKKDFSINISLDTQNKLNDACYYPVIKASTFYKI